jgi:hypothetical protein
MDEITDFYEIDKVLYTNSDRFRIIETLANPEHSYVGNRGQELVKEVLSYLDRAKRIFFQLKQMEDSLVIARIVRGPDRRIFNIDVGHLPPQKAEAFMRKQMLEYQQKKVYNTETGTVDTGPNAVAMTEDFWFAKSATGGSTVSPLAGQPVGDKMADVDYFLQKLFRSLRVPFGRLDASTLSSRSKTVASTILQQEVTFSKFVNREAARFMRLITHALHKHLILQGLITEEEADYNVVRTRLLNSNLHEEAKTLEVEAGRLDVFAKVMPIIFTADKPDGFISKKFAMEKYLMMTDEEMDLNEDYLEQEQAAVIAQQQAMIAAGLKQDPVAGAQDEAGDKK